MEPWDDWFGRLLKDYTEPCNHSMAWVGSVLTTPQAPPLLWAAPSSSSDQGPIHVLEHPHSWGTHTSQGSSARVLPPFE